MELIKGQTSPEVWLAAVEHVKSCSDYEDFDVFLNIAEPTVLSSQDRAVYEAVDGFLTTHGGYSIHTVAETIFPLDEYLRHGAHGVFSLFPTKLRSIHKARRDGRWGSYSMRFLRQVDYKGNTFNPLEDKGIWSVSGFI